MKTARAIIIALFALAFTGCASTANLADNLKAFEALGITEAEIAGKFSHTKYTKTEQGGKIVHALDHSNPWTNRVRIVREVSAQ